VLGSIYIPPAALTHMSNPAVKVRKGGKRKTKEKEKATFFTKLVG
jgi:hypothetical protein